MSEMTKRVGKAVRKALEYVYDHANDDSMDDEIGRAAIEALREPTEGMAEVAMSIESRNYTIHYPQENNCSIDCWRAMIDEALK